MQNILLFYTYFMVILVSLLFIFLLLSKIKPLHNLQKVASFFLGIGIIAFIPLILIVNSFIIIFLIQATFRLSTFLLNNFIDIKLSMYFSILIDLIIIAYFLEPLGVLVIKILTRFYGEKNYSYHSGFRKIIKILKPKLCLYLLATIFTIIATIENTTGTNIINVTTWNIIKPYLFEATITFIAFDTFVSNINKNYLKDTKKIFINFIAEFILSFDNSDNNSPDKDSKNDC